MEGEYDIYYQQVIYIVGLFTLSTVIIYKLIDNLDTINFDDFLFKRNNTHFKCNGECRYNIKYKNEIINLISINEKLGFLSKKDYIDLLDEIYILTNKYTINLKEETLFSFSMEYKHSYIETQNLNLKNNESIIIYEGDSLPIVVFTKKENFIESIQLQPRDYTMGLICYEDGIILELINKNEQNLYRSINFKVKQFTLI